MSNARKLADNLPTEGQLGNRNLFINGAMQVAQRASSATAAVAGGSYITLDRYKIFNDTDGAYTSERSTTAPDGFPNSMKLQVTTADTSLSSAQYATFGQFIEAQNLQQLAYGTNAAKDFTLSFYVRSNKTGTYCIAVDKVQNTRYIYITEFTINAADTWERKTITISPDSNIKASGGAIDNNNGYGFRVFIWLASGTTYHGTNNSWNAGSTYYATSNQVNWMDSTSNNFYVTGMQLEVGSQASPFEHRSFGDELLLCKRYYESSNRSITGNAITDRLSYLSYTCYTTSYAYCTYFYEVEKRAIPTITHGSSNWRIYQDNTLISTTGAGGTDGISHRNFSLTISGPTFDVSKAGMCDYRVHDGIKIDAEL